MAKDTTNQKKNITKPKTNKRKKYTVGDYVAYGVFALILLVVLGATGYFYGIHRPKTNEDITQKAEEFSELFFNIDYEAFSFEPLLGYLSPGLVRSHQAYEQQFINDYRAKQYTMVIHEIESFVTESGWENAKVQVNILAEEDSLLLETPKKAWSIMHYEFERIDGEWVIARYEPGVAKEVNELNELKGQ